MYDYTKAKNALAEYLAGTKKAAEIKGFFWCFSQIAGKPCRRLSADAESEDQNSVFHLGMEILFLSCERGLGGGG